jgi:hypothetical protein
MTESWQDRATTWPLSRLFLVFVVVTGLISVPASWWIAPGAASLVRVVGGMLFAVLLSALMTLLRYVFRRRETAIVGELPRASRIELARALRLGEAPGDPALDEKALAVIDRRSGQFRRSMRILPWLWGLVLLFALVPLAVVPSAYHVARLVYYAVLVAVLMISSRRQGNRLNRAEQAIRARLAKRQ